MNTSLDKFNPVPEEYFHNDLYYAIVNNDEARALKLIRKVDIFLYTDDSCDIVGYNYLHVAAAFQMDDLIQALIDQGFDVNSRYYVGFIEGGTALNIAVDYDMHENARVLMKNGANPDISVGESYSARMLINSYGDSEMKQLLEEFDGIDIKEPEMQ